MNRIRNYFKYDIDNNPISFDKRAFLLDIEEKNLYSIYKKYHIPQNCSKLNKVSLLLQYPNIGDDIFALVTNLTPMTLNAMELKVIAA